MAVDPLPIPTPGTLPALPPPEPWFTDSREPGTIRANLAGERILVAESVPREWAPLVAGFPVLLWLLVGTTHALALTLKPDRGHNDVELAREIYLRAREHLIALGVDGATDLPK